MARAQGDWSGEGGGRVGVGVGREGGTKEEEGGRGQLPWTGDLHLLKSMMLLCSRYFVILLEETLIVGYSCGCPHGR